MSITGITSDNWHTAGAMTVKPMTAHLRAAGRGWKVERSTAGRTRLYSSAVRRRSGSLRRLCRVAIDARVRRASRRLLSAVLELRG